MVKQQNQLIQFDDIPALEEKLSQVEAIEKEWDERYTKLTWLMRLVSTIEDVETDLNKTIQVPALLIKLERIHKIHTITANRMDKLGKLVNITSRLLEINQALAQDSLRECEEWELSVCGRQTNQKEI